MAIDIDPNETDDGNVSEDVIDFFSQALASFSGSHVSVSAIVAALGDRSFGFAILLFALPMILPMPPGVPMTAGFVICIFAAQLILGRKQLWLPNWLARKQISLPSLVKAYELADRYLGWMFHLARPRMPQLTGSIARRVAGGLFLIMAALMILPIPLIGNILPAFACTVLALGLTDRDGLIYMIGIVLAGIAISVTVLIGLGTLRLLEVLF